MDYGLRNDGTPKGSGYLGEITDYEGNVMTEYSIGVEIDGQEVEIPTIVPTLSKEEIETLRNLPKDQDVPRSIVDKAVGHAIDRKRMGLSIYSNEYDDYLRNDYRKLKGL